MTRRYTEQRIADFFSKRIAEVESAEDELYRPPAFLMYAKEWLTGDATASFDSEQNGWYVNLLCAAWNSRPQATLPANQDKMLRQRCKYFQDLTLSTNRTANALVVPDFGAFRTMLEADYDERWQQVIAEFEPLPGHPTLIHHPKLTACYMEAYDKHKNHKLASNKAISVRYGNKGVPTNRSTSGMPNAVPNVDQTHTKRTTDAVPNAYHIKEKEIIQKNFDKKEQNSSQTPTQNFDPVAALPPEDKKISRGSRMVKGWKPPADFKEDFWLMETPDTDYDLELKLFIDHWIAQSGKAGVKLDWVATFRNWLRKAQKWSKPNRSHSALSALAELDRKDEETFKPSDNGRDPEHHPLFDEDELL